MYGVGGNLLSHNLPVAVPSARAGLASGFGMGPGVSLPLLTTDKSPGHMCAGLVLCQILHSGRVHGVRVSFFGACCSCLVFVLVY